jgi:hypothetical protein
MPTIRIMNKTKILKGSCGIFLFKELPKRAPKITNGEIATIIKKESFERIPILK